MTFAVFVVSLKSLSGRSKVPIVPPLFPTLKQFYEQYQMPLAQVLHQIEKRGLLVDTTRLDELKTHVQIRLLEECTEIVKLIGRRVVPQQPENKKLIDKNVWYLSSNADIKSILRATGLRIPMTRATRNAPARETTDEASLNVLFGETGNTVLKHILEVRELSKLKGTYLDALLYQDTLYCTYVAIGTVSGRRSSRANFLGLGCNGQNIPKHSALGKAYRQCLVARPGKIFVACDQKGAEDWIVQAIIVDNGGSSRGLDELRAGINRHIKRAAFLFGKPESEVGKSSGDPPGIYYDLGKRTGHGNNYGMRGNRMSETLAKYGVAVPPTVCDALLEKANQYEPDIRHKFQGYVETTLKATRCLTTPIGRIRQFLGLRPYADNSTVFREAYSYIPQSTVGDNTGLAMVYMEHVEPGLVVADGHDAVYTEVDDTVESVTHTTELLASAFDRTLRFPNGTEVVIPVEYELGYTMGDMFSYEPRTNKTLEKAYTLAKVNKAVD